MGALLEHQSRTVIEQLIKKDKKTLSEATRLWNNSQTKKILIANKLTYVSGMRCYWELCLELRKDARWMSEPFDM